MARLEILKVFLHEHEIGTLTQLPNDRNLFVFNEDYINDVNRPTLSLSFKDKYGGLITDIKPTQTRVPAFFSNLLPEGMMRDYLAKRAGVKSEREFYLLWILGQDLPGAIKIVPAESKDLPKGVNDNEEITEHRSKKTILRFSLAGIQLKFSAVKKAGRGLTIPTGGIGGKWIVKLPDLRFKGVPENEFAMMKLAKRVGINVPEIALVPINEIGGLPKEIEENGKYAFAIKRFDRAEDDSAIHIEDFAQILGVYPDKKYNNASYRNIAKVIWLETGEEGIIEFIRRFIFNVLIGNGDMHLKNWSLIYPDGHTPSLAPSYDFLSTIPYIKDETLALKFVDSKNFETLSKDQLKRFAAKADLPEKLVIDTASQTIALFKEIWYGEKDLDIDKNVKKSIDEHLSKVPLLTLS